MLSDKVYEIDGVRISKFNSEQDVRGTFLKFNPFIEFENTLNSVALSFNPIPGTLRGLHFQVEPFAEEKLIACVQGLIFDVIVDLRPSSSTFGNWTSFELSATNALQIYLPKGIAHGFQTLLPDSIIHYTLSSTYAPEFSYAIAPFSDIGIDWPMKAHLISERDETGVSLSFAKQKYAESLKN